MAKTPEKTSTTRRKKPAVKKPIEENSAPEPNGTKEAIARIDAISKNARGSWFGLLGALVFAGITILGVEDVDFFAVDRVTKLPLVGVSVPIVSFFAAGALLITAFFVYLHLYLEMLWKALGVAPPRVLPETPDPKRPNGDPLSEHIFPWLVTEWALRHRDSLTENESEGVRSAAPRAMSWIGNTISVFFVWFFGPIILFMFWYWSLPAHYAILSITIALMFTYSIWTALLSYFAARRLLQRQPNPTNVVNRYYTPVAVSALFVVLVSTFLTDFKPFSFSDDPDAFTIQPVSANLIEAQIAIRPSDWKNYDEAEKDFRAKWAKREGLHYRDPFPNVPARNVEAEFEVTRLRHLKANNFDQNAIENFNAKQFRKDWARINGIELAEPFKPTEKRKPEFKFQTAWKESREIYLSNIKKPILDDRNLQRARMEKAFLPGAFMRWVNLKDAVLTHAKLEGADLSGASFENADLSNASLEGADLSFTILEGVDLSDASLEGANFRYTLLEGADLTKARLQGADLRRARLEGADLSFTKLQGADLRHAGLEGAIFEYAGLEHSILINARLVGTNLRHTNLEGAILRDTRLEGVNLRHAGLEGANLSGAILEAVDLWDANLEGADLWRARLFGTIEKYLNLNSTNLVAANFSSVAIRFVDLSSVDLEKIKNFENSFGDASVLLPDGYERPCHWSKGLEPLGDAEYFGSWHGWLEKNDIFIDGDVEKFPAIEPDDKCVWKTEQ